MILFWNSLFSLSRSSRSKEVWGWILRFWPRNVLESESTGQKTGKAHLFAVCKALPTQALYKTLCRKIMQPHPSWISMFPRKLYVGKIICSKIAQCNVGMLSHRSKIRMASQLRHEFAQISCCAFVKPLLDSLWELHVNSVLSPNQGPPLTHAMLFMLFCFFPI